MVYPYTMNFTRQRDGNNFPLYDNGLVFAMNFDNVAALGESATIINGINYGGSTIVKDISPYNEITSVS